MALMTLSSANDENENCLHSNDHLARARLRDIRVSLGGATGETLEHATEVALVADPAFDLCRALPALFLDGAIIAVRPGATPCRK